MALPVLVFLLVGCLLLSLALLWRLDWFSRLPYGTAPLGGGQFGHPSPSLDSTGRAMFTGSSS